MTGVAPLILVVDDQPGVRRLIQELFRDIGYRVRTAANGLEALAFFRAERPALVLLDMKMPVMDGLETMMALRKSAPDLPVVMMTADGDGDRVEEAMAMGVRACINKPFDVFELRRMVEDLIKEG